MSPAIPPAIDEPMLVDDVDFFDPAVNDCPYRAYRSLRDDAPVWYDERLRGYVVTRHDDVLEVLRDSERFRSGPPPRRNPDGELHAEMMADTFVGNSETTTNALSGGVRLLIENPDQWDRLKSDPEHYVPILVEEVVRLESPLQRLMRHTAVDVEMHDVTIPAGSMVLVGYSAANRDDRVFEAPAHFDLDRSDARKHLSFGFGIHHCLGAPLARRELKFGFAALVERIDEMWFLDDTDLSIAPNYFLRALRELKIGFRPAD